MRHIKLDPTTVKPVKELYAHDRNFTANSSKTISTQNGLTLYSDVVNQDPIDVKYNNSSMLTLTDKKYTKNTFKINYDNSDDIYPYTFITYFVFSRFDGFYYQYPGSLDARDYPGADKWAGFLNIEELANDSITTRNYTISSGESFSPIIPGVRSVAPSTRLFRVELLDQSYCRINHDDGYMKTCLTYSDMANPTATCIFDIRDDDNELTGRHPQVFEYSLYDDRGYIMLSKILDDGTRTIIYHKLPEGVSTGEGGDLCGYGELDAGIEGVPDKALIRIRKNSITITSARLQKVDTMWVKYKPDLIVQNSMEIDDSVDQLFDSSLEPNLPAQNYYYMNSYVYLANNYLINSQYCNLTGNEMLIDYTPLKNQLTPEGRQSESSPHSLAGTNDFCLGFASRTNTEFRTYHKIFSGTNQNRGDDRLYLGYTSYNDTVHLPGDNVTYFHMPESLSPYYWMNINYRRVPDYVWDRDFYPSYQRLPVAVTKSKGFNYEDYVGLISSGAIAGDDPMTSDKIFKMRADYRYFSNWGDSGRPGNRGTDAEGFNVGDNFHGTWLCSWLQSAMEDKYDIKYGPVWMDRYYDDSKFSTISEVLEKPASCVEKYIDGHSLYGKKGYFDAPSQMTLDRGVLYAYHHIGQKDNQRIIKTYDQYIVQSGLDNFTSIVSGVKTPGSTGEDGDYVVYPIDGTTYGTSKAPDPPYGDFRLSFWVHSDDWNNKFGHQIMGNYVNEGFAVVNDDTITPVMTFIDTDNIKITNTSGDVLMTVPSDQYTDSQATIENSTVFIDRTTPLGNLNILTAKPGYAVVNTINFNGANVNNLIVDDPTFTAVNQNIIDIATYKPTIDNLEFAQEKATFGTESPEELMYVLFENGEDVGQINLTTGRYRDPNANNYWVTATLSGVKVYDSQDRPLYDGTYVRDDEIEPENGAPVYTNYKGGDQITTYLYFDGSVWHVTRNANLTTDVNLIASETAAPPTEGLWTFANPGATASGKMETAYSQTLKKPRYVASTADGTPSWQSLHVLENGELLIIDGHSVCTTNTKSQKGTNQLLYIYNGDVYTLGLNTLNEYYLYGTRIIEGGDDDIQSIRVDEYENIWLLWKGDGTRVSKYDKEYNHIFTTYLSDTTQTDESGEQPGDPTVYVPRHRTLDLVKEYTEGGNMVHEAIVVDIEQDYEVIGGPDGVSFLSTDTPVTRVHRVSQSGKHTVEQLDHVVCNAWKLANNFTNYDHVKRSNYRFRNTFTFKFRAKNKYLPTDFVDVQRDIPVSNLTPGWHHFCFGYDAKTKSIAYFYVDGMLYTYLSLISTKQRGKHAFTDVMSKTSTIGATQGYNNVLLSDYIKKPGYYHVKGMQIKSYRLYNFNMYRAGIKALSREHIEIPDMDWTIPCGRRAHLDHVTTFHKHMVPGHKTGDFEVTVANTAVSGAAQTTLQQLITATIDEHKLSHTNLMDVKWAESPASLDATWRRLDNELDGDLPL